MRKINENILTWCNEPEQGAIEQAINISKHPCLIGNVALMPDTHQGYGMPIGGVACLENAVCPNMVGVDIGCGMLAVKTSLTDITQEEIKKLFGGSKEYQGGIKARIPVGMRHNDKAQENSIFENIQEWCNLPICYQEMQSAMKQLGTLGGGNHFIEIQKGDDGHIWFMIHSGSRNLGFKVANHYNKLAESLCKQFRQDDVVENELAFLPKGLPCYDDYIAEMEMCLKFAYENRKQMAACIKEEMQKLFDVVFLEEINIHHNYASLENHYGKNVVIHRKGATLARENTIGIIPGSQGTCSYIVKGKGNKASMDSCSHGAGRKMSRKKACELLSLEEEQEKLKDIVHSIRNKSDLEEASSAYKDIDVVMDEQKDLVDILVKLTPLGVIKG